MTTQSKAAILALLGALLTPDAYGNISLDQSPPQFDTSLKLATMAAVNRALGNMSGTIQQSTSGGLALTVAQAGNFIDLQPGFSGNVVLPLSTGFMGTTAVFTVFNGCGSGVIVQTSGSDKIYPSGSGLTSVLIPSGDSMQFVMYGTAGGYIAWSGAAQLQYSPLFAASLTPAGYQKLPSGFLMQWFSGNGSSSGFTSINFPLNFPNGVLQIVGSCENSAPYVFMTAGESNAGVNVACFGLSGNFSTAAFRCIAIGR